MSEEISMSDFARAREALVKADVKDCKLYLHPSGALIAVNGTDKARIINEWALEEMMEEMASLPKEDFGKREPGEVCTYELSRIPQNLRKGYKQAVKEGKANQFIKDNLKCL